MTTDQKHDANYLSRREAQERALAEAATDPAVRCVHHDLAERYAAQRAALMASDHA